MKFLKLFVIWCLFCLCYCQEGENDTVTDQDLVDVTNSTDKWISSSLSDKDIPTNIVDVTNSTDKWISSSLSDEDNPTTPLPGIITTMSATTEDILDTTTNENNNSVSVTTSVNLSTSTDKDDNFSACEPLDPCKNGGVCLEDPFDPKVYSCMCPTGYEGNRCGVKDNCAADDSIVCKKGYCSYSEDRSVRSCKCFFGMFWDDIKEECKDPEPPCFPNPCRNGGVCKVDQNRDYKCECSDGYEGATCNIENKCGVADYCSGGRCEENEEGNLKICTCSEGKYWNDTASSCEDVKPPCIPDPCKNHGLCQESNNGDYICNCRGHYYGKSCEIEDTCYSKKDNETVCGGKGSCQILESSSQCQCVEGYYFDIELHTCQEMIPPCFPNPCSNDGLCTPLNDQFNCTCSEGYTGSLCKDLDFCVLQGGHDICGSALCENSNDLETFHCRCDEGFHFDFKSRTCFEINFCPIMTCGVNEQCVKSECICQDNYVWSNVTRKCEANFCAADPCPVDDMICTEGEGISDYYCSCREGYSFNGVHCTEAICVFPSFNDCDQICVPSEEGFICNCDTEYFILKDDNKTCTYTGNTTCSNKTCDMGKCFKDNNEEETCVCPAGFIEEDGKCIDVCKSKKLPEGICPGNLCKSTNDGFRCKCEGKYKLSKDKVTCTNRRMCSKSEEGAVACAAKNAVCIEDWNSDLGYACQCTFPQKESNQGMCQDACNNDEYQRNCSAMGARCDIDTNGEIICKCPPLYKQTKNGEFCNQPAEISYLITIPLDLDSYSIEHTRQIKRRKRSLDAEYSADHFQIQYDAEEAFSKIFPELIQLNVLNCKKNLNYYLCKIELQFMSITDEDLKRIMSPAICLTGKDFTDKCIIPPSLISRKNRLKTDLSLKKSDPCDTDVKEKLCGTETVCTSADSKKSFNCTCEMGYEMRSKNFPFAVSSSFIEVCNDINECLVDGVCPQHTTCENLIGSYSCSCMPGYRIKDKSSEPKVDGCVEICNPNPCDHGTCERNGVEDFVCRCEVGFAGVLCDLTDSNFKRAQTNTIIVGAVLGGVLLITIIIFFVTVQRLKKKTYGEPDQMLYAAEMTERRGGAVNNAYQ